MNKAKPTVYLLYGDDLLGMQETIANLRSQLGEPAAADLNFQRFNGRALDLPTLEAACLSIPFMTSRRIVLVENAEAVKNNGDPMQRLLQLLPRLPTTTALVFVAYLARDKRDADAEFRSASRLVQWIEQNPASAYCRSLPLPRGEAFERWLRERARKHGTELTPSAAQLLAEFSAGDPLAADLELAKLADYVDRQRPVDPEDVTNVSPYQGQADIFAMVDAMGGRDARTALMHLERILSKEDIRYVFPMVVRQFRLILLAHDANVIGLAAQTALRVHPFVARKVSAQARNFSRPDLVRIYHHLLDIDLNHKTGREDLATALHGFVAGLAS